MTFLQTTSISQLITQGYGTVCVAAAPDGQPWCVVIPPPSRADVLLKPCASALQAMGTAPGFVGTPLEPIAADLAALLRRAHVQEVDTPSGKLEVRVLPVRVRDLTGDTLLARLVAGASVAPGAPPGVAPFGPPPLGPAPGVSIQTHPITHVDGRGGDENQPRFVPGDQCLAVSVDGRHIVVLRQVRDEHGWPRYEYARRFIEERFAGIDGATLCSGDVDEISVQEKDTYGHRCLQGTWAWTLRVPRNSLARVLVDLAVSLARLHSTGEIHGDLKPSNVLITDKGVTPFDGLRLRPGQRSPAVTAGWGAPEQVMARPVDVQTDQFPLGMMALAILKGVAYGEELRVIVPVGGQSVESHVLLRNGGAYVDPKLGTVDPMAIDDWVGFVERCLRFDPADRFPATLSMVDSLRGLVERRALLGHVEIPVWFGQRVVTQSHGTGEIVSAWVGGSPR